MRLILEQLEDRDFIVPSNLVKIGGGKYSDDPYEIFASEDGMYEIYRSLPGNNLITKEFWYEDHSGVKRMKRSVRTCYDKSGKADFVNEYLFNYSNGLICSTEYCDYYIKNDKTILSTRYTTLFVPNGNSMYLYNLYKSTKFRDANIRLSSILMIEDCKEDILLRDL